MLKLQFDGKAKEFSIEKSYEGCYSGGKLQFTCNLPNYGNLPILSCLNEGNINFFNPQNGQIIKHLKPLDTLETLICFEVNPVKNEIVTASQNFVMRNWDLDTDECKRVWKAHDGPILSMCFEGTGTLLATGSSDHTAKIWNIEGGYCTHNFRDHNGTIPYVIFNPCQLHLITCCDDTKIRIWDLHTQSCIKVLTEHMSVVTSISFSDNNQWMCTGGRDKVVNVYDSKYNLLKTILVFEEIEGIQCLNSTMQELHIVTAGETGILKSWKFFEKSPGSYGYINDLTQKDLTITKPFIHLLYHTKQKQLVAVTKECNFIYFNPQTFEITNQLVGYNDEIIDIKYIDDDTIAVAANSDLIRIFKLSTFSCSFLAGHTQTVLSLDLDFSHEYLVSCSKDNTVRLWNIKEKKCVAICNGHTSSVAGACLPHAGPVHQFLISGGNDKILKKWSFPRKWNENQITELECIKSVRAHEKEINIITISPNNLYLASGSQDHDIKLWKVNDLSLSRTLKGHKRGIWGLEFSPVEQTLLSGAGDKTIKLWNIKDGSCLKTFEGHNGAVLKVTFISQGLQVLSGSSDGLIKLWNIKDNECVNTFDKHTNKIWSIAVSKDNTHFISGGGDSILHIWKDVTLELEEKKIKENEDYILEEQELKNFMRLKQYKKAFHLSLKLNRPHDCLMLLIKLFEEKIDPTDYISECNDEELHNLLLYIVKWNTHSKNTIICGTVLKIIFLTFDASKLIELTKADNIYEPLKSYFERHMNRLDRLIESTFLLDYCLIQMGTLLPDIPQPKRNRINDTDVKDRKKIKVVS